MKLPNESDYVALYRTYHTPDNIRSHMEVVTSLAVALATEIKKQSGDLSVPLVKAAARLHDLVRIEEQWQYLPPFVSTPLPHAEINYLLLRDHYPEVADVIRSHSLMTILQPHPFASLEHKIVYYADKRVDHSTVVSLTDRLTRGQQRWKVNSADDRTTELSASLKALEEELFNNLTIQSTDLHAKTK